MSISVIIAPKSWFNVDCLEINDPDVVLIIDSPGPMRNEPKDRESAPELIPLAINALRRSLILFSIIPTVFFFMSKPYVGSLSYEFTAQ
jgi:hypothetical protein